MFMQSVSAEARADNVLVIGGCHVLGWKIGNSAPFWQGASNYWSDGKRTQLQGQASLKRSIEYLQHSDQNLTNTLLILQVGNFEANDLAVAIPLFRSLIGKLKHRAPGAKSKATDLGNQGSPELSFNEHMNIAIRGGAVFSIERFVPESWRRKNLAVHLSRFKDLLGTVRTNDPAKVIVLSTFPTASPVANLYRKILNRHIKRLVDDTTFTYVDAFAILEEAQRAKRLSYRSLFADGYHLSALGHSLLSDNLRDLLNVPHDGIDLASMPSIERELRSQTRGLTAFPLQYAR